MCLAGAGLAFACAHPSATPREITAYQRRAGQLVAAETSAAQPRGRYAAQTVRLTSSTGLVATGRLLRPANSGGRCYPALLLQDGREDDSKVVGRLPAEFGDMVVLALDYPREMPRMLQLRHVALRAGQLQETARKIPALFLLGASYLAQRSDVDSTRIGLVGTSFAVPFATIAAAADARFRNVALIYGAGDLPSVVAANLAIRPRVLRHPSAWLATRPFTEFSPERFVGRIAPRPIVMVNGVDDPQMPVGAVQRLYDAARQPKSLIWLRTGHLAPTDSALIRALVDTAFDRLPVLGRGGEPGRCGE